MSGAVSAALGTLSLYASPAAFSPEKFLLSFFEVFNRAASQANLPIRCCPSETSHTFPAGCTGFAVLSVCGHGYGYESKIQGLSSVSPTRQNRSIRRRSPLLGTSTGHQSFLGPCFPSLRGVLRLQKPLSTSVCQEPTNEIAFAELRRPLAFRQSCRSPFASSSGLGLRIVEPRCRSSSAIGSRILSKPGPSIATSTP